MPDAVDTFIAPRLGPRWTPIVGRPLTGACWRETFYLLLSFATGLAAFTFVITAISVVAGTLVVIVGLPLAILVAYANRWWCRLERHRAAPILGRPVPSRYTTPHGAGRISRWLSVLGDRQTWLDGAWMFVSFPVGLAGFVLTVAAWSTVFGLLTAPIWGWSIPGWVHTHDVGLSILAPFLSVPAAVAAAWLMRAAALGHAQLAALLLGQTRAQQLERRVQTLSETRADAVDAAVAELQRVERDLHDGAQARLVALAMDLGLAEQRLSQADAETALEHVASARGQARAAMAELRALVRGIGPSILQDNGLDAALTALVSGGEPRVELHVDLPEAPAGPRETAAYFVVAEALANARKHAAATHIVVRAWEEPDRRLIVEVVDDGIGGADIDAGTGLAGLRKRVAAVDGILTVTSPPGGPTSVDAEFPCA